MGIKSHYLKLQGSQDISEQVLNDCGIETRSIRFASRYGKWSMIDIVTAVTGDEVTISLAIFALFENVVLGDLTDYILAYFDWYSGDNCWKEIEGTYDDIRTALIDNEIVEP